MKNLIFLVVALVALCVAEETAPVREFDAIPRITGGTLTQWGEFPATVWIDSPFLTHNCVGTIVDSQHVLTAAHCVTNLQGQLQNSFWIRIVAGDINITPLSARREVRNVTRMYVHHNYNWNTRNNDLAVLRVNTPFPEFHNSIEPAMITNRLTTVNQPCRFSGWGAQANGINAPMRLEQRMVPVPILTNVQCNAANVHANRVQPTMICGGALATAPNTVCQGNSGGGMYCEFAGQWELTGVLSFGVTCGVANQPGVYIEVRQYQQWIQAQFMRSDIPPPGSVSVPM